MTKLNLLAATSAVLIAASALAPAAAEAAPGYPASAFAIRSHLQSAQQITPQTLETATDEIRNGKYSLFRHRCQPSAMPTLAVI